jgi:hypothetical protein
MSAAVEPEDLEKSLTQVLGSGTERSQHTHLPRVVTRGDEHVLRCDDGVMDQESRLVTVQCVIVEVCRKFTATGDRMVVKPYPKNDEPRTLRISSGLVEKLSLQVASFGLSPEQLLFSSISRADGNPISHNTFRTRVWLPALERSELGFHVRFHDLRHANASWAVYRRRG